MIDLTKVDDVPDDEYTRAYRAECEKLFADPDLRLVGRPDWRPPPLVEDRDVAV